MMTVMTMKTASSRENLAKARARVALTRVRMISDDKDDSRMRVALSWVKRDDKDDDDDENDK
jgi:predicted nucleic acid-binding protein